MGRASGSVIWTYIPRSAWTPCILMLAGMVIAGRRPSVTTPVNRPKCTGLRAHADWAIGWVVFDTACARVDRSLQLLLARDRHNSSVTGVAPPDAVTVRLTWRGGDVTEVPVVRDDVPAFVDTSERPPDSLVVAEALDADDNVVGTAKP